MASIPRLHKRKESGIYYCRVAVPKDLIDTIGKKEIKNSLGTADTKLARQLVLIESARINQEFAKIRGSVDEVSYSINHKPYSLYGRNANNLTFEKLIEKYLESPERQYLTEKTKLEYAGVYKTIKELIGSQTLITDITREKCRWFQSVILCLPANATKRFPNKKLLQIAEIAKDTGLEPMSIKNMNKYISCLSIALEWACKERLINANPARGLLVEELVQPKDKRNPFSVEQLRMIFDNPEMRGYKKSDNYRFWIPILSLWTGARLNELCQLRIEDIQLIEGILCINICEGEGKNLKTAAANRIIPKLNDLLQILPSQHADKIIQSLRTEDQCNLLLVIVADSKIGLAGVRLIKSKINGFRKEKIPDSILKSHIKLERHSVARADHQWIDFPLIDCTAHECKWEEVFRTNSQFFNDFDVIVSATADYQSELFLDKIRRESEVFPPVILTWLEAYALAGHCLILDDTSVSQLAYFDKDGVFIGSIINPEFASSLIETGGAACGSSYQPYGASQMSYHCAMTSELVIDTIIGNLVDKYSIWISPEKHYVAANPVLTETGKNITETFGYGFQKSYSLPNIETSNESQPNNLSSQSADTTNHSS